MSSRFLIPVLCVGAVVYACGPRVRSDASGSKKSSATVTQSATKPATSRSTRAAKDDKSTVSSRLTVNADPTSVRVSLHVVNTGNRRVEVSFPSGQLYDFVIVDSIGREVWHWGADRMFTQSLRNKLLDGGEAIDVSETWNAPALPAGRYIARGFLKSTNYPVEQSTEFVVDGTATVASKEEP